LGAIRKYLQGLSVQSLNRKSTGGRPPGTIEAGSVRDVGLWLNRQGEVMSVGKISESFRMLDNLSEEQRLVRQLSENLARQSLSVPEQMKSIKRLIEMEKTAKCYAVSKGGRGLKDGIRDVARCVGVSEAWIRQFVEVG